MTIPADEMLRRMARHLGVSERKLREAAEYVQNDGPELLFIDDIARKLGITVWAVRSHLKRNNTNAVPRPFRLGARRLAWRAKDFDTWLERKARTRP